MKLKFKQFVAGICIAGLLYFNLAQGATFVTTLGASGTNVLVNGPGTLNSITVVNSELRGIGTNYLIRFFNSTNVVQVTNNIPSFTNYSYTVATITKVATNVFGVVTTNAYTTMSRVTNNVASANVFYPTVAVMNVVSNTSQTLTFNKVVFTSGLLMTNAFGSGSTVIVQVDYSPRF